MSAPLSPARHYLAAEDDIAAAYVVEADMARFLMARAQVHATLATALPTVHDEALELHRGDVELAEEYTVECWRCGDSGEYLPLDSDKPESCPCTLAAVSHE